MTYVCCIVMLLPSHVNSIAMPITREKRTARLTILVDPDKKAVFEHLCAAEDVTPSQVLRRLIRGFIEERLGRPWQPGEKKVDEPGSSSARHKARAQAQGKQPR